MRSAITLAVLVGLGGGAGASVSAPESYAVDTPNGQFKLVMLVKDGHEPQEGSDAAKLNARYKQSGLYRADGSPDPLWTVDWYSRGKGIHPLNDGRTLVVVEYEEPNCYPVEWTLKRNGRTVPELARVTTAITFYRDGKPVRSHTVTDLFDVSRFDPEATWWGTHTPPDEAAGTVTLTAESGETVTLDCHTGERVGVLGDWCGTPTASRPVWVVLAGGAVVAGGTAAFVGLAVVLLRRQRQLSGGA